MFYEEGCCTFLNRAIIVAIAKIKRLHMKRGSRVMGKKESGKFGSWLKKYKHAWVFLYIFIYMPWFFAFGKACNDKLSCDPDAV